MPRIYTLCPLVSDQHLTLPPASSRHVQVLRLQPGHVLTLFNGEGGEYSATITRMGRSEVDVHVQHHHPIEREAAIAVHLVVGMPANERMDWLIEKATELGVSSIQPLMTAHSVLRLKGERADKKQAHWQAQAIAACEQSGRNRIPTIHPVTELDTWLSQAPDVYAPPHALRLVLSLAPSTRPLADCLQSPPHSVWLLNGPEGGLSANEDSRARAQGWQPITLGQRTLRAETAALAGLAAFSLCPPPL